MPDESQSETLTIKFEKTDDSDHSADAAAVASSIQAVNSLVELVHKEYEKDAQYLVKARPFNEGSLEIPLELILFVGGMVLTESPFFEKVWDVLKQFIDIKKRLAGNSFTIQEGNVILIENSRVHVESIIINMLDPDSTQGELFSRAFTDIAKDSEVSAVSLNSSNPIRPKVRIPRKEFTSITQSVSMEDLESSRETSTREIVTIRSVSFDPNLKWHFFWKKTPITAFVLDASFKERMTQRKEIFASGDKIDVELHRIQTYDAKQQSHIDRHFTITEVYNHIKRQKKGTDDLFE